MNKKRGGSEETMQTTTIVVEVIAPNDCDDFKCLCGNTAMSSGFSPVHIAGDGTVTLIEPLAAFWQGITVCGACGRFSVVAAPTPPAEAIEAHWGKVDGDGKAAFEDVGQFSKE